jgi:hypothetical protein
MISSAIDTLYQCIAEHARSTALMVQAILRGSAGHHAQLCLDCTHRNLGLCSSVPASGFLARIAMLLFEGVSDDTETGEQEGIEICLWSSV